jgi:hypothetical protein
VSVERQTKQQCKQTTASEPTENVTEARNVDVDAIPFSYSYVTTQSDAGRANDDLQTTATLLRGIADAFNEDPQQVSWENYLHGNADDVDDEVSTREQISLNDFDDTDFALAGAFPEVFLLGRAYFRPAGNLTCSQLHHLLRCISLQMYPLSIDHCLDT